MDSSDFTLHSVISSRLMKRTLFKGIWFALVGIIGLLIAGIFLPVSTLQELGFFIFLFSIGLIAFGMLPYKRLSRLQLNPNRIIFNHLGYLEYYSEGNKQLTIPIESILKIAYEDRVIYGISVWIKHPCLNPVIVHKEFKGLNRMRLEGRALSGADFFIPYFNERAFKEVSGWL